MIISHFARLNSIFWIKGLHKAFRVSGGGEKKEAEERREIVGGWRGGTHEGHFKIFGLVV